jgi:hypothetical protein
LREGLGGHGDKDAFGISFEHVCIRSLALLALEKDVHLDLAIFVTCFGIVDISLSV